MPAKTTWGADAHPGAQDVRTGNTAEAVAHKGLARRSSTRPGSQGTRRTGLGATRQSEGTAAGSGPCAFAHPRPLALGSLPASGPSGRVSSAASRRWRACWPTRLAGGLYGIANRSRDGTHLGLPFRLPARDRWTRSDLPQRVGMACTSQPSPVARQASREGDSPPFVNGVKSGAVTPHRGVGRAGQCVAGRAGVNRHGKCPGYRH